MDKTRFPPKLVQQTDHPPATSERTPAKRPGVVVVEVTPATPPHSWRRTLLWGLVILVVLGTGGVVVGDRLGRPDKQTLPPETEGTRGDPDAVTVTVEPVAYRSVQRSVEAIGTLYGFEEVSIAAKVDGRVRKIHHDVSDEVKPGDLLVEFDPTDYELLLHQAEKSLRVDLVKLGVDELSADAKFDIERLPAVIQARERLNNAKLRFDRVRSLAQSGAAPTEELTDKTADYRAAEAEYRSQVLMARSLVATAEMKREALAIARQQLKDMLMRVPQPLQRVPGMEKAVTYVMSQRAVSEGSFVRTGTEVCKLVIDRMLKLRALVPERFSNEIQRGQQVQVSTAANPEPVTGLVARINPTVDPVNRTFQVEIAVPNPEAKLKPGCFAKAAILTKRDSEVTTVPLEALTSFAGITKLFVVENGHAKEVRVTLGVQNTEWVEVASPPLPRGAQVVLSGQSALADGTPVAIRYHQK
jgi:multidrug efflux pump subunit AcrA (membrane-fusion protein)